MRDDIRIAHGDGASVQNLLESDVGREDRKADHRRCARNFPAHGGAHAASKTLNESPARKCITFIVISFSYVVSSPEISIPVED